MKPIIPPVDRLTIETELTDTKFLRNTNKANNIVFVVDHRDSPNVMREIGRLRELTFRAAGGGTGKEVDIDLYDVANEPYKQLIVWDALKQSQMKMVIITLQHPGYSASQESLKKTICHI
jgi:hypothetical protein